MTLLIYNGSFEGLLTAVFETYERKLTDVKILKALVYQPELHSESLVVISDPEKAKRIWEGLKKRISIAKCNEVYKTFLSELPIIEDTILSFIRHVFSTHENIEKDYGHKSVLAITKLAKQVHHEKHRMEAFVRFQRTKDDLYYASIEPDYNVLPLIASHFKERYADQHWLIYDKRRSYGIQYDKNSFGVYEVELALATDVTHEFLPGSICHEDEPRYQNLWKDYFQSVNIGVRKNTKLHLRHVPVRYWKYLVEKR